MHKQAKNAMDCLFWYLQGVCKDASSFEYCCWQFCSFTQVCFTPQTAKSKTAKCILLRSVLPPKTAKSNMDLAVLLWQFYPQNCQE